MTPSPGIHAFEYIPAFAKCSADNDATFTDLQPAFGKAVSDYQNGAPRSWLLPDGTHPTDDEGGGATAAEWLRVYATVR